MRQVKKALAAWNELGNINVDINDNIESHWRHFPEGTYYIELWTWIEEEYGVPIEELKRIEK